MQNVINVSPRVSVWGSVRSALGMSLYMVFALYASQHTQLQNAAVVWGALIATVASLRFIDWKDKFNSPHLNAIATVGGAVLFLIALPVQMF